MAWVSAEVVTVPLPLPLWDHKYLSLHLDRVSQVLGKGSTTESLLVPLLKKLFLFCGDKVSYAEQAHLECIFFACDHSWHIYGYFSLRF